MYKISDILSTIIENEGISTRSFEQQIGCSNGVISRCISKGTDISSLLVSKIIEVFPKYNSHWIMTGRGYMLNSDSTIPLAEKSTNLSEGIPLLPIHAVAGFLSGEQTVLEFECERYVIPTFKGSDFLMPVKGDSMVPKYFSGDIIACKRLPIDTFFQWNKPYVIDTDQGALVKLVMKGSTKETLMITSENDKYPPFELSVKHIYGIAIVIGVIRLE